jgi:predicted nuclease of predicted toxin-antitoxin system
MKVLIDECLPAALKEDIAALGHECQTVRRAGFGSKRNGELLTLAERHWDVLLTSDRNIKYQQHMKDLVPLLPACAEALRSIRPGTVVEVGPL